MKLKRLLYFGIFLVPLVMNPWGFQLYGSVKVAWFLMFVGLALAFGLAKLLVDGKLDVKYEKRTGIYLLLWLLVLFGSTVFSLAPLQSFWGEYFHVQGLMFYVFLFVHFFICWQLFSEKSNVRWFLNFVKVLGVVVSLHAIGQYFNVDPFVDVDNSQYLFRVYSNVGQPNFLAQFLIFPFFVFFFSLLDLWKKKKYRRRFLFELCAFVFLILAIYLTKSRAVLLALMLSLYLWFLFFSSFKRETKVRVSVLSGVLLIGLFSILGVNLRSINSRWFLWVGAFDLFDLKTFFVGDGLNSFYREFSAVMPKEVFEYENFYTTAKNVHNEALQSFLNSGVLGLVLYLVPIVYLIKKLFLEKRKEALFVSGFALLAYYISVQFSFSVIEHFIFLAAFWTIFLMEVLKFKSYKFKHLNKKIVACLFLAVFSVFGIFASISLVKGDVMLRRAVDVSIYDVDDSYALFEEAVGTVPVFAYPHKLMIDLFSRFEFFGLHDHLLAHGRITSGDSEYWVLAMKVYSMMRDYKFVEEIYTIAVDQYPNVPMIYTVAGNLDYEIGDCDGATAKYKVLESLAPSVYQYKGSDVFELSEKYRLFIKHATLFDLAMRNMESCDFLTVPGFKRFGS